MNHRVCRISLPGSCREKKEIFTHKKKSHPILKVTENFQKKNIGF
jgi:hypothetical protein